MSAKRTLTLIPSKPSAYVIERWKRTRFWSITRDKELIALCAYKKGATAVVALLDQLEDLREKFAGLRFIDDLIEPATAARRR